MSEQRFIPIRVRGQVIGEVRGKIFRKTLNSTRIFYASRRQSRST